MSDHDTGPPFADPPPLISRAIGCLLQVIALNPGRPFFQRELAGLTGVPYAGVVQALHRLVREGLVTTDVIAGRPAFLANTDNPYLPEYQRIALKSLDIPGALAAAGIIAEKVAVFGSFAKGEAAPGSDLDIAVIGREPDLGAASKALEPIGRRIGREFDVVVYDHARYMAERADPASFMAALVNGPLVPLRGSL